MTQTGILCVARNAHSHHERFPTIAIDLLGLSCYAGSMDYTDVQKEVGKTVDKLVEGKAETQHIFGALMYMGALLVVRLGIPKGIYLQGASCAFQDAVENESKD